MPEHSTDKLILSYLIDILNIDDEELSDQIKISEENSILHHLYEVIMFYRRSIKNGTLIDPTFNDKYYKYKAIIKTYIIK